MPGRRRLHSFARLPVSGPPIACSACPSSPRRPPYDRCSCDESRQALGLIRVERESPRRVDDRRARRDRLVQRGRHPVPAGPAARPRGVQAGRRAAPRRLCRSGRQRRAVHAGGIARYGEEVVLYRPPQPALPAAWKDVRARSARIRPAVPLDAVALMRLYASATPELVQRLEAIRLSDWERQGGNWRVPRSSLAPILRFADVEAFVQEAPGGGRDGTELDAFVQVGVAKEDQPHYLKVVARPGADVEDIVGFALGSIADRTGTAAGRDQECSRPFGPTNHPSIADWKKRGSIRSPLSRCSWKETLVASPNRPSCRPASAKEAIVGSADHRRESIDDLSALFASLPPEIVDAVHALPDKEALIEVVLDLGRRPEARFPDSEEMLLDREITELDIGHVVDRIGAFGGRQPGRHRANAAPHLRDPQPDRQDRRAHLPGRPGRLRHDRDHRRPRRVRESRSCSWAGPASARRRCSARPPASSPTTSTSGWSSSTPRTRSPATATFRTRRSAAPGACRCRRRRSSTR